MSIHASCGHQVQEIEDCHEVATKEWTINEEGWCKAIGYKSLCEDCYENYKKHDAILYTEAEEFDWLKNKENE
jgi:hypothetical protein